MKQRLAEKRLSRRSLLVGMSGIATASILAACGGPSGADNRSDARQMKVVAAESFWGSIATQLGGRYVDVTSLIDRPGTDPHDFEPKPSDARTVADARYVILNGAGYDPWMQSLIAANPTQGRTILNVGDLVGRKRGDNPHLWYSPEYVRLVIDRITRDIEGLAPSGESYFAQRYAAFLSDDLKAYREAISLIRQRYGGIAIGATESVFVYMAEALGLDLITPVGFMNAISAGNDVTATDKATFDRQIAQKQIALLVYNTQNATPATEVVKQKAKSAGIPVVGISETLSPGGATFQSWQVRQLTDLQQALAKGTGR